MRKLADVISILHAGLPDVLAEQTAATAALVAGW
jgi:hypothetical protein